MSYAFTKSSRPVKIDEKSNEQAEKLNWSNDLQMVKPFIVGSLKGEFLCRVTPPLSLREKLQKKHSVFNKATSHNMHTPGEQRIGEITGRRTQHRNVLSNGALLKHIVKSIIQKSRAGAKHFIAGIQLSDIKSDV